MQFDITEENGVSTIKLVSEKTFYLDDDSIVFSTNPINHSTKAIETYGISLVLEKTENTGSFYSISEISEDTNSEATYTFGGDSEVFYNNGKKIKYKETGKAFYGDKKIDGDVTHARLSAKGFEQAPTDFHFLHIAAPIFLLILTRLRMPVSTTFILLTSFATSTSAIGKVLAKSMSGYILAFFIGLIVFLLISKLAKKYFTGEASFKWTIAQWITSGTLWS